MPQLDTVEGKVQFIADTSGVDEASASIRNFGSSVSNIGDIVGGLGLANLIGQIQQVGSQAVSMVSDFQSTASNLSTTLQNVGDSSNQTAETFGGNASKMKNIAQEITDATITYNEKIAKLQDEMATVLKGQNVIDATNTMNQKLEDLAQSHANKILSIQDNIKQAEEDEVQRAIDRAQKTADSLQDMKDSHAVQMADKAEKYQLDLQNASSDSARAALTRRYNEEVTLAEDAFTRQYNLKKSQDERNNAEADARDKAALKKKLEGYQDEMDKENASYAKKYAQDKAADEKRIGDLEEQNTKKLALYKQELADEERTYAEHIAKLKESEASGGGGGGDPLKLQKLSGPLAETRESIKGIQDYINQIINQGTPFAISDWEHAATIIHELGGNFQQMAPSIQDFAALNHMTMSDVAQTYIMALSGNARTLSSRLHVTVAELNQFGAQVNEKTGSFTNLTSLFTALDKIAELKGANAGTNALHTLGGASTNATNQVLLFIAGLVGIDDKGNAVHNGAFAKLIKDINDFATYIKNNHQTIVDFGKTIEAVGGALTIILLPALMRATYLGLASFATKLGSLITVGWDWVAEMATQTVAVDLLGTSITIATLPVWLIILAIAALLLIGYELITHWQSLATAGVQAWNTLGNAARTVIKDIIDWINKLLDGISRMTHGIINIPKISYADGGAAIGGFLGPLGAIAGYQLGSTQNSSNTWDVSKQNWQANPLESAIGSFGAVKGGGGAAQNPASQLNNISGGNKTVNITNNNNMSSSFDSSALSKQLGLQVLSAMH